MNRLDPNEIKELKDFVIGKTIADIQGIELVEDFEGIEIWFRDGTSILLVPMNSVFPGFWSSPDIGVD